MKGPILSILLGCCWLISCNKDAVDEKEDKTVFCYNESSGISSLDPLYARNVENIWAINQIFNGLVQMNDDLEVKPCISKSWEISEDGLTYTFHLREATHGNGDPVTASDAHFSITKISDPNTAYGFVFDPVETMEVLDSKTLRIKLKHKYIFNCFISHPYLIFNI